MSITKAQVRARLLKLLPWALVIVPIVVLALGAWERRWVGDDGLINVRVARNVLEGHGPVFNIGERVEGYTSALWLALIVLAGALGARLEPAAAYMGIVLSLAGLSLAMLGAAIISGRRPTDRLWFPLGALVYAVVPVAWDYASSGLENGLLMAWMGASFAACAAETASQRSHLLRRAAVAMLIGLGPLARPELIILSAGLLAVLAARTVRSSPRPIANLLVLAASAVLVPAGYQVFRMGYYAAMVPQTALAKTAFDSRWEQGLHFFHNFFGLYQLGFALSVAALVGGALWTRWRQHSLAGLATALVVAACGMGYTLYVVRLGGGFMHGRMFLAPLFCMLMPVAVVPVEGRWFGRGLMPASLAVTSIWAAVCGLALRVPVENEYGIGDERGWYARSSGHKNPILLEDYTTFGFHADGRSLANMARNGCAELKPEERAGGFVLVDVREWGPVHPYSRCLPLDRTQVSAQVRLVAQRGAMGIMGNVVGADVHLVDHMGLTDPVAARIKITHRSRPGHERALPNRWLAGRFAKEKSSRDPAVHAAYRAMRCGPLAELMRSVREPLTARRFAKNMTLAWRHHRLQIPPDPFEAERQFCGTK